MYDLIPGDALTSARKMRFRKERPRESEFYHRPVALVGKSCV